MWNIARGLKPNRISDSGRAFKMKKKQKRKAMENLSTSGNSKRDIIDSGQGHNQQQQTTLTIIEINFNLRLIETLKRSKTPGKEKKSFGKSKV